MAPASAVLPRRRRGRKPHAVGAAARDQGLPGDGACTSRKSPSSAARSTWCRACWPSSKPTSTVPPTRISTSRAGRPTAWIDDDACYILDNFFMAYPDSMIRPHPRYHELYLHAVVVEQLGRASPGPVPPARPARPPGLVEPGVDPSPALREGPRAGRIQGQGPALHRGREAVVPGQAARAAGAGDPAPPRAGRARSDRADHDAVLSPDPAPAPRQDAGARGDARRGAAGLSRRLPRRRRGARPPRRRKPRPPLRRAPARHVAERRLGLPGDRSRCWPSTASSGSRPTRRSWAARPTARSVATAGATSAIPSCSIGPGRSARPSHELAIVFRDHSMSDQIGFHYQRSPGPVAAADFLGKLHAIGDACRHEPGDARPGHPRRRELLGVLPGRRRVVPPLALPGGRARPADPAGQGRRVPPRASAGRHVATGSSPEAGSATTSPSGSAIPRTTAAGTPCTPPASSWSRKSAPAGTIRRRSPGPGTRSTSPRAPTGSGGTATTIPAPSTACSTTCSASTCATSTRSWAATRRARCSRRSRGRRPPAAPRPADQFLRTSRSMVAPPTSSGSTRRAMSAATTAGP